MSDLRLVQCLDISFHSFPFPDSRVKMGLLVAFEVMTIHKRFITIDVFTFIGSLMCVCSSVLLEITFCSKDFPAILFRTIECVAQNNILLKLEKSTVVTCVDSPMGIEPVQRVEGGETLEIFADEGSLLSVDPDVDLEGV